MSLDGMIAFF
jgi:hypothetical protein